MWSLTAFLAGQPRSTLTRDAYIEWSFLLKCMFWYTFLNSSTSAAP